MPSGRRTTGLDQKLVVHAFIAELGLLLGRVLLLRAQQRAGYRGPLRRLIQRLAAVCTCTVVHVRAGGGRPSVTGQREERARALLELARAVGAVEG